LTAQTLAAGRCASVTIIAWAFRSLAWAFRRFAWAFRRLPGPFVIVRSR
jgi:hypothetical protein